MAKRNKFSKWKYWYRKYGKRAYRIWKGKKRSSNYSKRSYSKTYRTINAPKNVIGKSNRIDWAASKNSGYRVK